MSKYPQTPEEAIRCLSGELARSFYEQANRLFLLETPLGRDVFLLETLRGKECVSDGGFCLEVTVLSDNAHLQEADMLGLPVLLRTRTVEGSPESDRLFHGLITAATFQGANGGFARYVLRIEPWLSDLKHRIDSYVFKDMTVFEIVEEVLKSHPNIHIHWRWSIADREIYPRRSVTMQYWESDFEFIQRLLAEEGLYYWFEHSASDDATLGRHTLVIADHMGAWRQNAQGVIPFQRADVTEPEDSIVDWQHEVSIKPTKVIWKSWDYKRTDSRPEARSVDGPIPLVHHDDPGLYAWRSWADAERKQKNALTALQVRAEIFEGVSTVRTLNAGSWFKIARHYEHDAEPPQQRAFNVIEVEHYGRNNFREEVRHSIVQLLGPAPAEKRAIEEEACYRERQIAFKNKNIKDPDPQKDRFYQGAAIRQGQDYWNRFTAIRRTREFRPLTRDGYGAQIHPKPTIRGTVTAVVVGVKGEPIHTDRDHRIKIQCHWQRGSKSASRLKHPSGDDNAPSSANDLGFWVRLAAQHAGDDYGSVFIPRVGQEVAVMFMNGDIDRPVVIGAVYNGEGQVDEQVNQVQNGAPNITGNAPAWFAGKSGEHAHPGVFSGIKTQEMSKSQDGWGGYSELRFDDTPGQTSLTLATTQKASRLVLGQHRIQNENRRGPGRGHGAELATLGHGVVRGGGGVLISTEAQPGAQGSHMDSTEAANVIRQNHEMAKSLAENAKKQDANLANEPEPEKLPAIEGLVDTAEVIETTQTKSGHAWGGAGTAVSYRAPNIQFSAPAGVFMGTPREVYAYSVKTSSLTAGEDVNIAAKGQSSVGAAEGIAMYAVGEEAKGEDPIKETGIRLHAAHGDTDVRSLEGPTKLASEQTMTLASTENNILIHAPEHVLFNAGGAELKLTPTNIQLYAPGKMTFKASKHVFVGPKGVVNTVNLADPKLVELLEETPGEIEAVILYPSLGTPQILPAGVDECSIVVVTDAAGKAVLSDPAKASPYVNRHLRLMGLEDDKTAQTAVKSAKLYTGMPETFADTDKGRADAQQFLEAKELHYDTNGALRVPGQQGELGKIIGSIAPEALQLYGPAFSAFFEIRLKQLGSISPQISATPKSWAWIVTTDEQKHLAAEKEKKAEGEKNFFLQGQVHMPQDRMLDEALRKLVVRGDMQGHFLEPERLFEVVKELGEADDEANYPLLPGGGQGVNHRVQVWHPVMIRGVTPKKFGHLTDIHINVRQSSLARSPVRVMEVPEPKADEGEASEAAKAAKAKAEAQKAALPEAAKRKIGERVGQTLKAFKSLIDRMKENKADALLLTGDYVDFNRNLDPAATKGKDIGQLWSLFNVYANSYKPGGPYKRGMDYLYMYSLMLYALREQGLPSFMVTGNHEGYQFPYGISPRANDNPVDIVTGKNATVSMNSVIDADNKAWEKREAARRALEEARRVAMAKDWKLTTPEAADELPEVKEKKKAFEDADEESQRKAQKLKKFHEEKKEMISEYHQRKTCEGIPSDHNLTVYEAVLAFGPSYGQLMSSHNFRHAQLDMIHWIFTPFMDINVHLGTSDLLGKGAQQTLTLLGWGEDERLIPSVAEVIYKVVGGPEMGEDRRTEGFLPYACNALSSVQLETVKAAAEAAQGGAKWAVASHFTIANFEDSVPLGHKEPGFWPEDKVQTGFTRSEARSQFNHFNWGGCELNLRSYLEHYVAAGAAPGSGQVAMHFSGHSHRAGVYTLEWAGQRVLIEGQVPAPGAEPGETLFIGKTGDEKKEEKEEKAGEQKAEEQKPGEEAEAKELKTSGKITGKGTKFVVSGTGGPMGKQALNGWVRNKEQPEGERGNAGCFGETEIGKAFLGGWLTRPPSGTLADIEGDALQYVATSDEDRNEKPRLAVMLDYRDLMSVSKRQYENRPLYLCPDPTENPTHLGRLNLPKVLVNKVAKAWKNTKFDEGLPALVSYEMKALDCMTLEDIKVWVWKVTAPEASTEEEPGDLGNTTEQPTGEWVSYSAYIKDDVLHFKDAKGFMDALGGRGNIQSPEAAFMQVPLREPAGVSPAGIPWDKEVLFNESWIFPVDIGVDSSGEFVRRSMVESGEIPNWEFLGRYFTDKGYPPEASEVKTGKKRSTGNKPLSATSEPTTKKF